MAAYEVKIIHAHREVNGKLEYLVEWTSEQYNDGWEIVERSKMQCSELIQKYQKKLDQKKYWKKVLDAGSFLLEKDLESVVKPPTLPNITDFRSSKQQNSNDGLPKILSSKQKEGEEQKAKQPEAQKSPSDEAKIVEIFTRRTQRDVPHFLCGADDGEFLWVDITTLKENKLLEQFYFMEQIIKAENDREEVIDLARDDDEPRRKKAKWGSLSSSATKSPSVEKATEISIDDNPKSQAQNSPSDSLICEICNKQISTRADWGDHVRNHKKYECHWCKKEFNWRSLPAHCQSKHKKKGLCFVCGVVAKSPASCKNLCLATKGKLDKKKTKKE